MPSTYAHYRFGCAMLANMPGDTRRTVQRFRRLFDVGLHGPDIFYYQPTLFRGETGYLGVKYHDQPGRDFFQRACRAARMERSEAAMAYIYGVLCHYCLDSVCYPFIKTQAELGPATAMEIETEFDRYLLELDGRVPPCAQDLSPHLKLTPGECETVARFYPPATARNVQDSVKCMAWLTKLLATPEGTKRKVMRTSVGLLARDYAGLVMNNTPNPNCAQLDTLLLARYREAEAKFPEMLRQMSEHLTYSAPFEADFDPKFG